MTLDATATETMRRDVRNAAAMAGAVLLLVSVGGCRKAEEVSGTPQDEVVARFGDSVVTIEEVEKEIGLRLERGAQIPDLPVLIDDMIERRLLIGKAIAEGLDQDPDLRRSWENLLIGRYKENHLREELRTIEVGDQEVALRYERDAARYSKRAKARLAILTLPISPVMTEDERQAVVDRMAEGRAKALAGKEGGLGFGALAVNYSEDQVTRHRGGDTGWLDEGVDYRWPANVVEAGFALKPGQTSEPIIVEDAVHLVMKLDERPAERIPLDQVRDQIRKDIRSIRISEKEASFDEGLRAGIEITTYPEKFSTISVPEQPKRGTKDSFPPDVP